jgi:hypothetical protein
METAKYVKSIVNDANTNERAKMHGLNVNTVSWEDTGRWKGSSFGSNISDMTLRVDSELMPIIRHPNYSDMTCDMPLANFMLMVGNELGEELRPVPLKDYLENFSTYSGNEKTGSLLCERDLEGDSVIVSAQACVLPCDGGKTDFSVQLFNYQSVEDDPSVLVILASANGTSSQPLGKNNQELFHSVNGERAPYQAQRLEERRKELGKKTDGPLKSTDMDRDETLQNALYVIQVPLKRHKPQTRGGLYFGSKGAACFGTSFSEEDCDMDFDDGVMYKGAMMECAMMPNSSPKKKMKRARGMDMAHLGIGKAEGEFYNGKHLQFVRDDKLPIRITLQAYRVTDDMSISSDCMADIALQLGDYYSKGSSIGSLVIDDRTGRVTEGNFSTPTPEEDPFQKFNPFKDHAEPPLIPAHLKLLDPSLGGTAEVCTTYGCFPTNATMFGQKTDVAYFIDHENTLSGSGDDIMKVD